MDRPLVVLAVFAVLWLCSFYEPGDVVGSGLVLHKLVALTDATLRRLSLAGRNRRATAVSLRGANHSIHVWQEHHSCCPSDAAGHVVDAYDAHDQDHAPGVQQQQQQEQHPQRSVNVYGAEGRLSEHEEGTCDEDENSFYVTHRHYFKSRMTAATAVTVETITNTSLRSPQSRAESGGSDALPSAQSIAEVCTAMVRDLRLHDRAQQGGFLDVWSDTEVTREDSDDGNKEPAWVQAALNHYLWTGGLKHAITPIQELVNKTRGLRYGVNSASDPATMKHATQHACTQRLRALVADDAYTPLADVHAPTLPDFANDATLDTLTLRVIHPSSEVPFHTTPPRVVTSDQDLSQDDAAATHHLGLRRHNRRPRTTITVILPLHNDAHRNGDAKAKGDDEEQGPAAGVAVREATAHEGAGIQTPTLHFCNLGPRQQCLKVGARSGTVLAFDSDSIMHAITGGMSKPSPTTDASLAVLELSVSFLLPHDERYKPPTAEAVRLAVKEDIYRRNRASFREYLFNNADMKRQMMDYIVQQSMVFPAIVSPVQFNVCMLLHGVPLPRAVMKALGCGTSP